jgi:hypothetical protein
MVTGVRREPTGPPPSSSASRFARPRVATQIPSERRRAGRRPSDLPGYVTWGNRLDSIMRCRVRDMSASGALLALESRHRKFTMDQLPDGFTLVMIHYREETHVECRVMRRMGSDVGVRFVGQFRTAQRSKVTAVLMGR